MKFPLLDQLNLPCLFQDVVPGALHADGSRYLPLLVFRLDNGFELAVVDRHHRVDLAMVGRHGRARLVFLLSTLRLQHEPYQQGFEAEHGRTPSTRPYLRGRVLAVPTWEAEREHLPYEALYTELLLDSGSGVVGVRTSATAANLAESLGSPHIQPGDWLTVERSRIDILDFAVDAG